MNKGQRLYKFILGLLMPFLFLACSSKERIKIDGGTFNVDGKDGIEYNISLCVLELSRTTAR